MNGWMECIAINMSSPEMKRRKKRKNSNHLNWDQHFFFSGGSSPKVCLLKHFIEIPRAIPGLSQLNTLLLIILS